MLCRTAACGIAAFILILSALASYQTNAFADADVPPSIVIATILDQIEDRAHAQPRDDVHKWFGVAKPNSARLSAKSPTVTRTAMQSPAFTEPFGLDALSVDVGSLLTRWKGVETEIGAENEILAHCRESAEPCPSSARKFLAIIAGGHAQTGRARIGFINRAINLAIHPNGNLAQGPVRDRWSAPLDTLSSGQGDCKDYAIAKYVALREAGVAADDVRLIIVRNLAADEDHAIVAARLNGNWIMLDNRWQTLVEDSEMRRVIPLFVLDHDGVKQFAPAIRPTARNRTALNLSN